MSVILCSSKVRCAVLENSAAVELRDLQTIIQICPRCAPGGRFIDAAIVAVENRICMARIEHKSMMVCVNNGHPIKWIPIRYLRPTRTAICRLHQVDAADINVARIIRIDGDDVVIPRLIPQIGHIPG